MCRGSSNAVRTEYAAIEPNCLIKIFDLLSGREVTENYESVESLHAAQDLSHGYVRVVLLATPVMPPLLPKHVMITCKSWKNGLFPSTTKTTNAFEPSGQRQLNNDRKAAFNWLL